MLVNIFKLTGHTNIDHPFTYLMSVLKIADEQNYKSLQKFWEKPRNQAKLDKTQKAWYLYPRIFWAPVSKI